MLASRVRVRPCRARDSRSSSGRATLRAPSSCSTVMGAGTECSRDPLGPFTVTSAPLMVTSTPAGTGTGSLPIRDIGVSPFRLPDVGEDFAAHTLVLRLTVSQEAGGGGQDGH